MNYFAESAFENIQSKVLRLREKGTSQRRLIVTTSAFPADVTLDLARMLDEFVLNDGRIVLTFRVAGNLSDLWRRTDEPSFREIVRRGWMDDTGNLTGYRNAPPPEDGRLGLVVLVGADKVTDSSGLADFYRCDAVAVWEEQMKGSFAPWTRKRLDAARIGYEDATVEHFDTVLNALEEQGCADFFQIVRLLRSLPLETHGAQDGKDAERILLRGLGGLGLPSFAGFDFKKKKSLRPYLETAIRFFRYDLYLEERNKKNALKAIDLLRKNKSAEIGDNSLFTPENRGAFETDKAFIEAVERYVRDEDQKARNDLFASDFIVVNDKILKFKIRSGDDNADPPDTLRKLAGGSVEVVLTALWQTLMEARKEFGTAIPELAGISIRGEKFKYDNDGLTEGGSESAAERQGRAKDYLRRLVGGVDRYFADGYLDLAGFGDEQIPVASNLYHEEVACTNARTAEPLLEFQVKLTFTGHDELTRKFAWRLPETQPFRMAEELIQWTSGIITDKDTGQSILPVFHIPYHEELLLAKDDDEARRVLLHAVRDMDAHATNLITEDWRKQNEPLLPYLDEIADAYGRFIDIASQNGLHSVFHPEGDGREAAWDVLRKACEKAMKAYTGDDEQCRNSSMAAMLMRMFLMVVPREGNDKAWVADCYERSGIVTVLHPSVLEMLCHHIAFLFACFNYAAPREWRTDKSMKPFHPSKWQDYLDLATIQMPLGGLIKDENRTMDTKIRGQELLHCLGSPAKNKEDAPLSTRLLLRYEGFDDEATTDADMFAETRESRLLQNILSDYLAIHPHARDGISLAVYRNKDIQPVISAVHGFLAGLREGDTPVLDEYRQRPYAVVITVFTEAGEDVGVARWIEQWKERWEAAESEEKYAVYRHCRFSIAHRVVPEQDNDRKAFARMIRDGLDVDIAVLYDFIGAGLNVNEFQRVEPYNVLKRTLKFPIIEKSFCMVDDPQLRLRRARIIRNPQFRLASLHLETMARLKTDNVPPGNEHVLIGYGDFATWQEVVDELHKRAEWVVCIDPSIDDMLIKMRHDAAAEEREIIGFGSGVGLHGELNFTISTEHFRLSDILYRLERAVAELYPGWPESILKSVAESVMKEAQTLSGLSLVRATGVGTYLHDFMAYSLSSKLLATEDNLLCSHLISLDAYRHWFTDGDQMRPDLLWLAARLDESERIVLSMHLIECKLGIRNEEHVEKAVQQVKNGLNVLIPAFLPKAEEGGDDARPDRRYWWLQLHRLIASKTRIARQRQAAIMAAMERLAAGDYAITWHGAVLAFWTDSQSQDIEKVGTAVYEEAESGRLEFGIYALGQEAVRGICSGEKYFSLPWNEPCIGFDSRSAKIVGKQEPAWVEIEDVAHGEQVAVVVDAVKKPSENAPEEALRFPGYLPRPRVPERILLGRTVAGNREVYWEFGNKDLSNRHMLIFGASGMGKTYAIQCLLCELGRSGQNSLIIDYTNGFLPKQLEKEVNEVLKPEQHYILNSPLPINPFRIQSIDHGGFVAEEKISTVAKRIAAIFQTVYGLGEQQFAVLYAAISQGISESGQEMSLACLLEIIESFINDATKNKSAVQTTLSKIRPFIDDNPFGGNDRTWDWKSIFDDPEQRCHIFQLAGLDSHSWRLVTEFVLWDFYGFLQTSGRRNEPKVVVLDEVQNLDHKDDSPLSKYLREGRKFGISLIMATQIMSNLNKDERDRLFNAGHKLFFRPADTEIKSYAEIAAVTTQEKQEVWMTRLSELKKGECYSLGWSLNSSTGKLESKAFHIRVASLRERFSDA